jgi:outer membrane protein OmpA-like peptidoglycan-associated protein/N-acetylneuraminic acid mutarotase
MPTWAKKADFKGGKVIGAVSFSIGEKKFVCFGSDGNQPKKDCWEYDQDSDSWEKLTDFPGEPRMNAVAFTIGDKAYIGTGLNNNQGNNKAEKDFWEYNSKTSSWKAIADLPGDARYGAVSFSIGEKGYVCLGATTDKIKFCNDLWEYDPAKDQWTKKTDFPEKGKNGASAFVIGNNAYVLFGGLSGEIGATNKSVWGYNAQKDKWEKDTDFPGLARLGAISFSANKKGYISSGYNGVIKYYNDLWEYDPKSKAWSQKQDAPFDARYYAFSFVIDNLVYIGTGSVKKQLLGGGGSNDVWCATFKPDNFTEYNAKLLYDDKNKKLPLAKQGVSLIGAEKNVIQKTTTDNSGLFVFKEVDMAGDYKLVLDKNDNLPTNAVVSIAKPNGKIIQNLEKNTDGQFSYEIPKLDEVEEDDSYFNLQYFMKSPDKEITITANIFYPSGSSALTKEAQDILYQVIVSLNQYPGLTVAISSHTDSRGDDASNLQLSDKRAKAAADYIISNNISAKRVSGKGFGESMILNKCKNGVDCTEEEHKVNRRTEFKFIKTQ